MVREKMVEMIHSLPNKIICKCDTAVDNIVCPYGLREYKIRRGPIICCYKCNNNTSNTTNEEASEMADEEASKIEKESFDYHKVYWLLLLELIFLF